MPAKKLLGHAVLRFGEAFIATGAMFAFVFAIDHVMIWNDERKRKKAGKPKSKYAWKD